MQEQTANMLQLLRGRDSGGRSDQQTPRSGGISRRRPRVQQQQESTGLSRGLGGSWVCSDLTTEDGIELILHVDLDRSLKVLVNNAAMFEPDSPDLGDKASWDAHFQLNVRAPFRAAQPQRTNATQRRWLDRQPPRHRSDATRGWLCALQCD